MKITRLQRGYRIRLSDSEFAALQDLCIRGEGEIEVMEEHEWDYIEPTVKRGLKTMSWALHEDRRK